MLRRAISTAAFVIFTDQAASPFGDSLSTQASDFVPHSFAFYINIFYFLTYVGLYSAMKRATCSVRIIGDIELNSL